MNVTGFLRLVRQSMRGRRVLGTVLFVAIVALASATFAVGLQSRQDAGVLWDGAFDRAVAPHVTLSAVTPEALDEPASAPGVVARSAAVSFRGGELVRPDGSVEIVVRAAPDRTSLAVGQPYVVSGRLATTEDEVTLERSFADDQGVAVGDRIELRNGATVSSYTVVGEILDFNDCFYPQCDPGVVWATSAGLGRLGAVGAYQTYLRLADPDHAPAFVTETLRTFGDQLTGSQDWLDTRSDALAVNDFFGLFLAGFGVFVLIAAGVVVAGSVTNRVLARRRDIGLLKAAGVTPHQVEGAIVTEHVLLGGAGVLLGWLAGTLLAPGLRIGVTEVLEPAAVSFDLAVLVGIGIVFAVIVVVATVLPARRAARQSTAETLQPPVPAASGARVGRLATCLGAGPVVLGGVKDVFHRPVRTVLAAVSVVLAVVAVLVTFGFAATVDRASADPALVGDPWDAAVVPNTDVDAKALTAAIEATPGVAGWFSERDSREVVDGEVLLVRAVGGDPRAARFVIHEGRPMTAAGEGIAGYGLLQRLGRRVGDTVTVEIDDDLYPVLIVGRYGETEDTGEVLQMRMETLEQRLGPVTPNLYRVVARDGIDREALAAQLQQRLGSDVTVRPLVVETEGLDAFYVAFWVVASLLLVVALANFGATMLLGVRERARELGVLRAIGYTPMQLVGATAIGAAVLVVLAVLAGVPLGLWLNDWLLTGVGKGTGAGPELGAPPALATAATFVALLVAAAVAIGALTCVQLSRRPVSELVQYE
ncbi:MAG TPA: FtsX-like permease family protein [Acidimicrobiales bacterium]